MPSLCPCCGRIYCDHTTAERGQTYGEMMREPTEEELQVWRDEPAESPKKIAMGKKNAHFPVSKKK